MANNHNFRVKNGLEVGGSLQIGGDANPTLTGDGTYLKITTSNGYIDLGAGNASYLHFHTDRPSFYFNKKLVVDEGTVQSYDEDLNLNRAGSTTARLRITAGTTSSDQSFNVTGDINATGYLQATSYLYTRNNLRVLNAAGDGWHTWGTRTNGNYNLSVGTISSGNITTTGYLRGPSTFTIDPATHGDDTGTLVIAGNLQVDGTTTTVNSTTVAVSDLNFTVAKDAANAAAANNAGLTVAGADAQLKYLATGDKWTMNKPLVVTQVSVGDGTDGYFYSDQAGRTAFNNGDFYIQTGVTNYYNYATNQYHGNNSGDNHYFRGNPLSGNNWSITAAGVITATGGNSGQWNTAYGWGNHASAGYLTSYTDTNTHTHLDTNDNRTIAPSEFNAGDLYFGFTSWANNNTSPYADYLHMRSYTDSSGGADNMVMFKKSGIGMRLWQQTFGSSTNYSNYEDVWHTGNLTTTNKANYDTAYGWGNHASAGYYAASNPNGYTNDQTAAEILTAIKTVDGDGSGLDADTLDGVQLNRLSVTKSYGTGNITYGTTNQWYSLIADFSENESPITLYLKSSAHSSCVAVISRGYHGNNVANINILASNYTQNGGYPGVSGIRVLKTTTNVYKIQIRLTFTNASVTSFGLKCKVVGGNGSYDLPTFETSLAVDTTSGTVVGTAYTNQSSNASSFSTVPYVQNNAIWHAGTLTTTNKANYDTAVTVANAALPKAGGTITGQVEFPSSVSNRPVLTGGFLSRQSSDGDADIWGISENYYPSEGTTANAWGIRWASSPNHIQFVGANANKVTFDLDNGAINSVGVITASGGNSGNWNTAYTTANAALPKAGGTMTGTITGRDFKPASGYHYQRSNHHSGHLEGSYNNVGDNSYKSNPIYTIGSSYNPVDASLSNMYGIGYGHSNASFTSFTGQAGWGLYVATAGTARIWLGSDNGVVSSTGEHYVGSSRVFHDAYHPNADKWTTARTLTLSGDVTGSVSFDGSAAINMTNTVVANDSHTHSIYLPKAGGAMTGAITTNSTFDGRDVATDGAKLDQIKTGGTLATYGTTAGSSGRIRCTAPFNTNTSHMFKVTVSIYTSYGQHDYVVGAYMYSSTNQWYSPTVIYTGTGNPDIVVGRDANGKAYISIANGNYTGVRVHSMTLGYYTSLADTQDPWTITINGATENSVTPTISKVWHSTNDGIGSGLNADLLDDQQGAYYLNYNNFTNTPTIPQGDITGVTAGNGLTGGGTSGTPTLHVGAGSGISVAADAVAVDSSVLRTNVTQTVTTGQTMFNSGTNMAVSSGYQSRLEVRGSGAGNDAFMTFHVAGDYATYLGLDGGTNRMSIGGWSMGAVSHAIFHEDYHPNADKWTTARTLTLSGDVTGSVSFDGSAAINMTNTVVANDSHTHSIYVPKAGGTMTGQLTISGTSPQMKFNDTDGDDFWLHVNSNTFYILADRDDSGGWETPYALELNSSSNIGYVFGQRIFNEAYHPNADKWTTARTLTLSGDVTGSVSWDGSANVTLTTAVGNDSHYHSQVYIPDTRGAVRAPSYYPDRYVSYDFQNTNDTGAGDDSWHVLQTVAKWASYDANHTQQQIVYTGPQLKHREATSDSAWGSWKTIWDSSNLVIGNYIPKNAYTMTGSAFKLGFHSGSGGTTFGANHYSMGVDVANGSWSGTNYSDLIIGYHTGIRIGAGYSGIRFYDNSPTTDTNNSGNGDGAEELLMTIGGGGTPTSGAHVTVHNNLTVNDNLYLGDGNDGYFYSDSNGRTAFAGGDFYIQSSVGNCYIYATNTYLGDSSGDNIRFRANTVIADSWGITSAGAATFAGVTSNVTGNVTGSSGSCTGNAATVTQNHSDGGGNYPILWRSSGTTYYTDEVFITASTNTVRAHQFALTAGNSNGIKFWNGSSSYAITMGNNQNNHGTVTDYSIHHNMDTTAGRGFTFGPTRAGVTCSINAITGAILSNNNITAYSDIRIKDNIEVIPNALHKVGQLSGYTFTRTDVEDKEERYTGVIAQEVLKVLPEAVQLGATEEDTMSVAYGNMVGLMIEAIKELKSEVDDLKTQLSQKGK